MNKKNNKIITKVKTQGVKDKLPSPTDNKSGRYIIPFVIVFFIITRIIFTFYYQTERTDLFYYGPRAMQFKEAMKNDSTIYEYNKKMVDRNMLSKNYEVIEYPPLTILWMSIPAFFVHDESFTLESLKSWKTIFKFFYFIFDLLIFLVILYLYYKPIKTVSIDIWGIIVYVLSSTILFNLLYDRQDFFLGGIMFLSLLLLTGKLNWKFSMVLLAIGINFKLIPLIIAPFFILGSIPTKLIVGDLSIKTIMNRKLIIHLLFSTAFLILMIVIIFLPFYIKYGKATLEFLNYHTERGIQLESTYSAFILLFAAFGYHVFITLKQHSFNLESSLSPILTNISVYIDIAILIFLFIFIIYQIKKKVTANQELSIVSKNKIQEKTGNLIQLMPQTFICFIATTLLFEVSLSKVFSPQYLLWVIPIFSIISYKSNISKYTGIALILTCILTTIIFPYTYLTDFARNQQTLPDGSMVWGTPTNFAIIILIVRNSMLILTSILLLKTAKQNLIQKKL